MHLYRGRHPASFYWIPFLVVLLTPFVVANQIQAAFDFEKSLSSCERPCFNGVCLNRTCVCTKGWIGEQCDHCLGRIRLTENQTSLSDGPLDYSSSSKCTWLIEPNTNVSTGPLNIRIDSFSTECGWDYLYIYDGDGVYGKQLAALCGEQPQQEITAPSGKAFIYFFSDLAMNLSGFSISYEFNKCSYNCSSRGICEHGTCSCNSGSTGEYCQYEVCSEQNDLTTGPCNSGQCESGKCVCSNSKLHGEYCQSPSTMSVWDRLHPKNSPLSGRASHASIVIEDCVWYIGGEYFDGHEDTSSIAVFNMTSHEWSRISVTGTIPPPRYDHTVVKYKSTLYMYGGVVRGRNQWNLDEAISNELWILSIKTLTWQQIATKNNSLLAAPFAVVGHSAHVVGSEMLVFFGYNSLFGYMHHIQSFNFETNIWSVTNTTDHVFGRYKHSSMEYELPNGSLGIMIFGGLVWNSTVNDSLMSFDTTTRKWTKLPSAGTRLYLHSATHLNGLMIVVGGTGHNTSYNVANPNNNHNNVECFSNNVFAYDLACKQWFNLTSAPSSFRRFGHTTVAFKDHLYVFGGFNGKILNDVWRFSPARCDSATRPDNCREINDGVKCIFADKSCSAFDPTVSYKPTFESFVKQVGPKKSEECSNAAFWQSLQTCDEHKDCVSCSSKSGCGWCVSGEQCLPSELECIDGPRMVNSWEKCTQKNQAASLRACSMARNCGMCRLLSHCTWYPIDNSTPPCISKEDFISIAYEYETKQAPRERERLSPSTPMHLPSELSRAFFRNITECPLPCSQRTNCTDCVELDQCMWCPSTRRCINLDAYTLSFAYGQCHSWVTGSIGPNHARLCQAESSFCQNHKTCGECQRAPECGWLADDSKTGLGSCVEGKSSGPLKPATFKSTWHFFDCPPCQCNGHSMCTSSLSSFPPLTVEKCGECRGNTTGSHCEKCASGYFGDARNGGECKECECNGQADSCDPSTGACYCRTKGVTGLHCDKCDSKYFGSPRNGTPCYYELAVDFIFTFKLKHDEKDIHTSEIYLFSIPYKRDTDVTFQISCENSNALVALNMTSSYIDGLPERAQSMMANTACDAKGFRRVYVASDKSYPFGTDANTTFYVRVYNFKTPITIIVSFAQSPPINWVLFFVIFAACFIVLLVVAGLLWMVKVRIEAYRRNRRRIDEIEHMASRPFASVKVELTKPSDPACGGPTPLSIEPCGNYRAGVFTLAVRLPTGGRATTPHGTSGIAVASALCLLTPAQLGVLQAPDSSESKNDRKRTFRRFIRLPNFQRYRPNENV